MAETRDKLSKEEMFAGQQLSIQRDNLLGVCRMCVKTLVDKSAFETISDDCPNVVNFCNVLEHIFTHRIQARWALFGSGDPLDFWQVILKFASPASVSSIFDMEEIQTELGRGRAWFRLSLVQKKLSSFMYTILDQQEILKTFYLPGAFLYSDSLTELAGTLKCLDAIDFNLCLRGQDFDFGDKSEISYSPYLRFQQSRTSVADDYVEEHKLLGQDSERVKYLTLGQLDADEVNGEVSGNNEETIAHLRECIKTERDQKNYFEELVSVRDTQLARIQTEMATYSEESEEQKKELEAIVLELQGQIEKLQLEVRECHHKLQLGSKRKDSASVEDNHDSPKKRSTSLLSGILSGTVGD